MGDAVDPTESLRSRKCLSAFIHLSTLNLPVFVQINVLYICSFSSTAQLEVDDAQTAGSRSPYGTPPERYATRIQHYMYPQSCILKDTASSADIIMT